ncbi:MAG: protein phosphatase 2C domain-containing protein [Cyanobacteria bacterium J06641_5]
MVEDSQLGAIATRIFCVSLPKIGESEQSIQDRYASNSSFSAIALADGAGSSLYPKKWAEILVEAFCKATGNPITALRESHLDWLSPLQEQWRQYYLERLQSPKRNWWEGGSQLKSHGSATFLGLWLPTMPAGVEEGYWQAVAVGDSCLFQWDCQGDRLQAFPLQASTSFRRTTQCFASLPDCHSFSPQFTEGLYVHGDRFLLATDALSKWILQNLEAQGEEWKDLFAIETREEFIAIVDRLRHTESIDNDDTTAIIVRNL